MTKQTLNEQESNCAAQTINDWRWQIVSGKNADFDNVFFTAVRTTRIYCKPSCPAKTPKRENVSFYNSCDEAEAADFRACLRCKPRDATFKNANVALVARALALIEECDASTASLEDLSRALNVSAAHLQRTFKMIVGVSPKEFVDARRIETFKRAVRASNVTNALYDAGFGSSRQLYEQSNAKLGMTPAQYKRGGKDMRINYAIVDCALGKMLIAATAKGVCKIGFAGGEDADELVADLKQEYPAAEIAFDATDALQNHAAAILENLADARKTLDLPLDIRATAFQLRVWAELRKIPAGETRSYKQVAENLGDVKAVRAIARACAANPVALVNPCHRVVGANGKMTGYRWGVARKEQLLEIEKQKNQT